jgi:type IV pilus assembly protein PilC
MARRGDEGAPLHLIFSETGRFPDYVCTLLSVAEHFGKSEETLMSLSRYYERRANMERQIRASMLYPASLMAVLLAVAVILLVWVLPMFNDVYEQLGTGLTGAAGALLSFGRWLRKALPAICALLLIIIIAAVCISTNRTLRVSIAHWAGTHFGGHGIWGDVSRDRMVQALCLAIGSGVTYPRAMELAAPMVGESAKLKRRCDECLSYLNEGKSLSKALRDSGLMEASLCRILDAGERSGQIELTMEEVSVRAFEQTGYVLERGAERIETMLIIVACVLVGAVLFSVMLPLVGIMNAIG